MRDAKRVMRIRPRDASRGVPGPYSYFAVRTLYGVSCVMLGAAGRGLMIAGMRFSRGRSIVVVAQLLLELEVGS